MRLALIHWSNYQMPCQIFWLTCPKELEKKMNFLKNHIYSTWSTNYFFWSCSQSSALRIEGKTWKSSLVSWYLNRSLFCSSQINQLNLTRLTSYKKKMSQLLNVKEWSWLGEYSPGSANKELVLLGQRVHNPQGFKQVSNTCNCWGTSVNV